jgi:phosphonate dehydrogenase
MAKPRVLITHWVHPEVIERLSRSCEVIANPRRDSWPRERVRAQAAQCEAMIAFMPDRVDAAFLDACPRLRVIAAALKGADNFDLAACARRGVWFALVPERLSQPTAELALALLLALARKLLPGDDHVRSGEFGGWRAQLYGAGLQGATLGIIGMGSVGRELAPRARALGMRPLYADPRPGPEGYERVELDELLARSDFIAPLAPLTPQTRHLIGAGALARIKPGAYLVNVGRGSLVDEAAVAASLAAGRLAGYAADVFEMEDWALEARPRAIHPALLADRERTIFTPHLGSAVDDARREIALEAADNVLDALAGRRPRGALNEPAPRAP